MIQYLNPKTKELLATDKEIEKLTNIDELKNLFKDTYLNENDDLILFNLFIKNVEDEESDDNEEVVTQHNENSFNNEDDDYEEYDDEEDVYFDDGNYLYIINKGNIEEGCITSYTDDFKLYKKVIVINDIPMILSNENIIRYWKGLGNIEILTKEEIEDIYSNLNNIKNYEELEEFCEGINDLINVRFDEINGEYVFIKSTYPIYENNITNEFIKHITIHNEQLQDMKEWSFVEEFNLNLEDIIRKVILKLIEIKYKDLDVQRIIYILDDVCRLEEDIDWDKIDINMDDMIVDIIFKKMSQNKDLKNLNI